MPSALRLAPRPLQQRLVVAPLGPDVDVIDPERDPRQQQPVEPPIDELDVGLAAILDRPVERVTLSKRSTGVGAAAARAREHKPVSRAADLISGWPPR
jgi:hypothetical protein